MSDLGAIKTTMKRRPYGAKKRPRVFHGQRYDTAEVKRMRLARDAQGEAGPSSSTEVSLNPQGQATSESVSVVPSTVVPQSTSEPGPSHPLGSLDSSM